MTEGCRAAQVGEEAEPHGERIRQATTNDDVGQQRFRAADQGVAQAAVAIELRWPKEGKDEEMTEALAAASAWERQTRDGRDGRDEQLNAGRFTVEIARTRRGGPPDDPRLTPADESQVGINEMAVIFMSLGVAPANFKVADLFCRNRCGEAPVEEVVQRVRDDEPVFLIGPPMCQAFSTLTELTQATGTLSEVKLGCVVSWLQFRQCNGGEGWCAQD